MWQNQFNPIIQMNRALHCTALHSKAAALATRVSQLAASMLPSFLIYHFTGFIVKYLFFRFHIYYSFHQVLMATKRLILYSTAITATATVPRHDCLRCARLLPNKYVSRRWCSPFWAVDCRPDVRLYRYVLCSRQSLIWALLKLNENVCRRFSDFGIATNCRARGGIRLLQQQ